ncbi:MAG: hypothetical protein WBP64_05645 [Nitrososphaeraceae archaeon]
MKAYLLRNKEKKSEIERLAKNIEQDLQAIQEVKNCVRDELLFYNLVLGELKRLLRQPTEARM